MDKLNREEAFEELYKKTSSKAYAIVYQMVKNEQDALDVLQDSYLSAYKSLDTLKDFSKMDSWFCVIAANKSRDYLRKKKTILFSEIGNEESEIDFEDTIENEYKEFIPEESVDYGETKRMLNNILSNLPEEQRMCILLYYYQELSVEEISSAFRCSEGTIKSRLNYGRKRIRAEVEKIEKAGTKLYGIAPIPFIIWMLHGQEASAAELLREKCFIDRLQFWNIKDSMIGENTGKSAVKKVVKEASTVTKISGTLANSIGTKLLIAATIVGVAGGGVAVGKRVVDKKENQPSAYTEEANESETKAAESLIKDEKILRAEAYYNYLKECEKNYGATEITASNTAFGDKLTGLCFAKLIDFDGDGQDEMVLAYENPAGTQSAPEYNTEIVGFDGEINVLFSGHGVRGAQGETYVYLNDYTDPLNYMEGEAKGETEHYQVFQYINANKFKSIKDVELRSVESGETFVDPFGNERKIFEIKGFIDGEEQEESLCRQEAEIWSNSNDYQFNIVLFPLTEELSTAQEELENTWRMLEEILQINGHGVSTDKTRSELNKEYYGSLLNRYSEAFEQQWDADEMKAHGLTPCFAWDNIEDISDIGYCFIDLNGNGIDEVLIGTKTSDNALLTFEWREYRKKDDFYIAAMAERRSEYYLKEGALCEVSYWGAGSKDYVYRKTDKGLLDRSIIEELHYNVYEENNRWTHINADFDKNDPYNPISENEAKKVMDSYKNLKLDWRPFSEYGKTDKKF